MKQFRVNLLVEVVVTENDEDKAMEEATNLIYSFNEHLPNVILNGVALSKNPIKTSSLCATEVGKEHPWHKVFCLVGDDYLGAVQREVGIRRG